MAVPAVTTVSPGASASTITVPANHAATTAGLSMTASTMTSAASSSAESNGFCSTISALVATVVDAIRTCLAQFPFIGPFFAIEEAAPTLTPRPTDAATTI